MLQTYRLKVVARNGRRNLASSRIDPNLQLSPRAPLRPVVTSDLPLAFAIDLNTSGIHHHVQGFAVGTAWQINLQAFGAADTRSMSVTLVM